MVEHLRSRDVPSNFFLACFLAETLWTSPPVQLYRSLLFRTTAQQLSMYCKGAFETTSWELVLLLVEMDVYLPNRWGFTRRIQKDRNSARHRNNCSPGAHPDLGGTSTEDVCTIPRAPKSRRTEICPRKSFVRENTGDIHAHVALTSDLEAPFSFALHRTTTSSCPDSTAVRASMTSMLANTVNTIFVAIGRFLFEKRKHAKVQQYWPEPRSM
ncbi:hypothetical protein AXG93_1504s1170 [Marchantia polymorpha subsp. ruderalis]|uniref:Uncharacterized protein n=1 Tax=Marchantia polymorpha subsp. ruderalis TaxID=1480154 RepID=A0A176VNT0_MARPO|nr:hypothetical protein AXG93_1504s1170 [Marchantia polymorpha subsp. ruderalis]